MAKNMYNSPEFVAAPEPLRLYLRALDGPGALLRDAGHSLRLFLAFTALYALLAALGYALGTPWGGVVVIWPAAGLLAGVLAATPVSTWPLWLIGMLAGRLLVTLLLVEDRFSALLLGYSVASCIEALVLALFIRRPLEESYRLNRPLYLLAALIALAVAATAIGGLVGAAFIFALEEGNTASYWQAWRIWVAADLLGILIVAPAVTWFLLPQIRIRPGRVRIAELIAWAVALPAIMALIVVVLPGDESAYSRTAGGVASLVLVLPLLWAALRFDLPLVALGQLLLATAVIVASAQGIGPYAVSLAGPMPSLAEMQLYLIAMVLSVQLIAFLLMEHQRAKVELDLHRGLGDVLVTLSEKLLSARADRLDSSIEDVLREIATFARADRSVLLQFSHDGAAVNATHKWTRDGAGDYAPELLQAKPGDFPWVLEQFREKGYVLFDNFSQSLPAGAEELEPIRKASSHTASSIYIGLFTDGQLIGAIGCSYVRQGVRWTNAAVSLMYLIGQLFANSLKRRNAERAVHAYQRKLQSLAADMAMSEERARRRTANDLHDGIGQNLAVARMKIGQLLATNGNDQLEKVRSLIDDALRGTRYIISDLSPTILYELGLVPALQSLAERFEPSSDIVCNVEESGEPWAPDSDMRIALYRAVQELLSNAARHARASRVDVAVEWQDDQLDIVVRDDGVGFNVAGSEEFEPDSSGFGLFSVRESVRQVGGTLAIESAVGIGTTVHLRVPRRDVENDE